MALRFTIRDLLWLTVVVALAIGWWLDHRHASESYADLEKSVNAAQVKLEQMRIQFQLDQVLKSGPPPAP